MTKQVYTKPECKALITNAEEMLCGSNPNPNNDFDVTINDYIDDGIYTETLMW